MKNKNTAKPHIYNLTLRKLNLAVGDMGIWLLLREGDEFSNATFFVEGARRHHHIIEHTIFKHAINKEDEAAIYRNSQ